MKKIGMSPDPLPGRRQPRLDVGEPKGLRIHFKRILELGAVPLSSRRPRLRECPPHKCHDQPKPPTLTTREAIAHESLRLHDGRMLSARRPFQFLSHPEPQYRGHELDLCDLSHVAPCLEASAAGTAHLGQRLLKRFPEGEQHSLYRRIEGNQFIASSLDILLGDRKGEFSAGEGAPEDHLASLARDAWRPP